MSATHDENLHPDDPVAGLRDEINEVGRRSEHRFDPGVRAVFIAIAVLVLLLAGSLPWVQGVVGWQVLFGEPVAAKVAGIAPRVFLVVAFLFGVLGSVVALTIRRYGAAWICSLGADLSVLFGALSVWSQQTSASHQPGPGPGPGLILGLVAVFALAILWGGIAWHRPRRMKEVDGERGPGEQAPGEPSA